MRAAFLSRDRWICLAGSNGFCIFLAISETERTKNPMVELFYGHFLAVGVLEGETKPCVEPVKEM